MTEKWPDMISTAVFDLLESAPNYSESEGFTYSAGLCRVPQETLMIL